MRVLVSNSEIQWLTCRYLNELGEIRVALKHLKDQSVSKEGSRLNAEPLLLSKCLDTLTIQYFSNPILKNNRERGINMNGCLFI